MTAGPSGISVAGPASDSESAQGSSMTERTCRPDSDRLGAGTRARAAVRACQCLPAR